MVYSALFSGVICWLELLLLRHGCRLSCYWTQKCWWWVMDETIRTRDKSVLQRYSVLKSTWFYLYLLHGFPKCRLTADDDHDRSRREEEQRQTQQHPTHKINSCEHIRVSSGSLPVSSAFLNKTWVLQALSLPMWVCLPLMIVWCDDATAAMISH